MVQPARVRAAARPSAGLEPAQSASPHSPLRWPRLPRLGLRGPRPLQRGRAETRARASAKRPAGPRRASPADRGGGAEEVSAHPVLCLGNGGIPETPLRVDCVCGRDARPAPPNLVPRAPQRLAQCDVCAAAAFARKGAQARDHESLPVSWLSSSSSRPAPRATYHRASSAWQIYPAAPTPRPLHLSPLTRASAPPPPDTLLADF
ncbi:hypothetical protein BGHDH14_bgh00963 [Blumeria hordei DH14]|uniref:Uncharacterized protein n=1 Tax=Blumeria graminis f. sp. hordei (strain DH14) TaxID=546991 RepID=N1J7M8_BLUG1|nr:hypothetical protein BGHDH14_bgh00963 [Blumeria hordei DH14]